MEDRKTDCLFDVAEDCFGKNALMARGRVAVELLQGAFWVESGNGDFAPFIVTVLDNSDVLLFQVWGHLRGKDGRVESKEGGWAYDYLQTLSSSKGVGSVQTHANGKLDGHNSPGPQGRAWIRDKCSQHAYHGWSSRLGIRGAVYARKIQVSLRGIQM